MADVWRLESAVREDAQYRQGLIYMQAGQWQQATECFERLLTAHPESEGVRRLLDEARFKAKLDAKTNVRPRRARINWRRFLLPLLVVVAVGVGLYYVVPLVTGRVIPMISQLQASRRQAELLTQANALFRAGELAQAETLYRQLLAEAPDNVEAQAYLQEVVNLREIEELYAEGVALQTQGKTEEALEKFEAVAARSPTYLDVSTRVATLSREVEVEGLFAQAEVNLQVGHLAEALGQYERIREINLSYRRETITNRLYSLYLELARGLVRTWPPERDGIEQALTYFSQALSLRPRDETAMAGQQMVVQYLTAEGLYYEGKWDEASVQLEQLYERAPDYLGGHVADMLYDAYVRSADQLRLSGDSYAAYDLYQKAVALPVSDTTMAQKGLAEIDALLLPTPTPTPRPLPTSAPVVAGPRPTPTPIPLAAYRGRIAFLSDNPANAGIWVMSPDGSDRIYLGDSSSLFAQYDNLVEQYRLSSVGGARLFVLNVGSVAQIFVDTGASQQQLTSLDGLCYDAAWSPDGSRIAFVSQHDVVRLGPEGEGVDLHTDDIWVMNADGSNQTNLTRGSAAWEKHPSWSPDGRLIAFWSNREGRRQIYVMAPDGSGVRNISRQSWDEYDPLWIR